MGRFASTVAMPMEEGTTMETGASSNVFEPPRIVKIIVATLGAACIVYVSVWIWILAGVGALLRGNW